MSLIFGCKGPESERPVVQYLKIADINTDTLDSDTVFNLSFPINSDFKLTDNEGVQQYRFEFIKSADSLPDLHFLKIENTGDVKEYNGSTTIDFDESILDTLPDYPLYYFITVDCFDKSGNQAFQKRILLKSY